MLPDVRAVEVRPAAAGSAPTYDCRPLPPWGGGSVKIKSKIEQISGILMMKVEVTSRNFEKLQQGFSVFSLYIFLKR